MYEVQSVSKTVNNWEIPISPIIPYLEWNELSKEEINDWKTSRHNHASYELHIVLSGECCLFINNTKITICEGQGILIAPEIFHAPKSVTQPFCRLSLSFLPNKVRLSQIIPENNTFFLFSANDTIKEMCHGIFTEIKNKENLFHDELLSNQFAQLILLVLRSIEGSNCNSNVSVFHPKQLEDMSLIDVFFVNTPPKERTKENLARLLHCSERQVLRKIQALYGMSFQKKLMLSKIDTAQHLLHVSDKNIEEICDTVGYSDKSALYKAFKLYTNTTPVKYRKSNKF